MIGMIIPVHDEQDVLAGCLRAAVRAASHPSLGGEKVEIAVVLDDCRDHSASIAGRFAVTALVTCARNVGHARALGARYLLGRGARWLASTDADSTVSPEWLVHQLGLAAEAVCGSISVAWRSTPAVLHARYDRHYRDADGHRHIHGANLGLSAKAYRRVGGFAAIACNEDVALVRALQRAGTPIAWSAKPRVATSDRMQGRAKGGFADYLAGLQFALMDEAVVKSGGVGADRHRYIPSSDRRPPRRVLSSQCQTHSENLDGHSQDDRAVQG